MRKTVLVQSKSFCGHRIYLGLVWLKNKFVCNSKTVFVQLDQLCCAVQLCNACSNNMQGLTWREGTAAAFLFQCTSAVIQACDATWYKCGPWTRCFAVGCLSHLSDPVKGLEPSGAQTGSWACPEPSQGCSWGIKWVSAGRAGAAQYDRALALRAHLCRRLLVPPPSPSPAHLCASGLSKFSVVVPTFHCHNTLKKACQCFYPCCYNWGVF